MDFFVSSFGKHFGELIYKLGELCQNNVDIIVIVINNMGGCEVEVEGDVQFNLRATTDAQDLVCDDLLYDVHCGADAHHSDLRLCALHSVGIPYLEFMHSHRPYSFILLILLWAASLLIYSMETESPLSVRWELFFYFLSLLLVCTGIGAFVVLPYLL